MPGKTQKRPLSEVLGRRSTPAEFAPGIPEAKRSPLPKVPQPIAMRLTAHPHDALRAGRHIDLRLGDPRTGIAHSFVLPTAELPPPGEYRSVIPTLDHTTDYQDFVGPLGPGYGEGVVTRGRDTVADVYHTDPDETSPGTKLRFNLYDGLNPEEFSVRRDQQGRWYLHNKTQTRTKRPDIPASKPKYREGSTTDLDLERPDQIMMPKLDGAHVVIDLKHNRAPRVFSYRVGKKSTTGLIEHTHKIPELLKTKVPKELDGTILRGELMGVKSENPEHAIPAERLAALLNTRVWDSRARQQQEGVRLRAFPFSVVRHRGKPYEGRAFAEQLPILQRVQEALPELTVPSIATTREDKQKLLDRVWSQQYPLTNEGVVLADLATNNKTKVKRTPDFDVFVRKVHPAISKTGKPHDRAGAVSYSLTPEGPIVGRVGGFRHDEAADMLQNPDQYIGRTATIVAAKQFPGGALFQPRFSRWHPDSEKTSMWHSFSQELRHLGR